MSTQNFGGVLKQLLAGACVFLLLFAGFLFWRVGDVEIIKPASPPKSEMDISKSPVEFSVLTYNVQGRPWFDDTHHKFPRISPLLNRFDIAGIQECFKDHGLLWAQANHPYKVYHATLRDIFRIVGSGLGTLSNFEVIDVRAHHFTTAGDFQNKPASKGILMVRLNVGGATLDVYNTHMEAGSNAEADASRTEQTKELIAFVKANSPAEHSVIFLGDFNMAPYHPVDESKMSERDLNRYRERREVRGKLFRSITSELGLGDASDDINDPKSNEIDRILYRAGSGYKMTTLSWQEDDPEFYDKTGEPLSDHEPVFANFRLEKI